MMMRMGGIDGPSPARTASGGVRTRQFAPDVDLRRQSQIGFVVNGLTQRFCVDFARFNRFATRVRRLIIRLGMTVPTDKLENRLSANPEAWLAAIVESSDDAIVGKTLGGVIRSWNAGAQRVFGYEAHEIIGQSVLVLIPPELQHEEKEIVARLTRGERVDHHETTRLRKDGSSVEVSLSVSPIHDRSGRIVGAAKIARDITEAKRLQRAEREYAEQMQNLATE